MTTPAIEDVYTLTMEITPETRRALGRLAKKTGSDLGTVIRSALGMYQIAFEAHKAGKAVGIAEDANYMQSVFF